MLYIAIFVFEIHQLQVCLEAKLWLWLLTFVWMCLGVIDTRGLVKVLEQDKVKAGKAGVYTQHRIGVAGGTGEGSISRGVNNTFRWGLRTSFEFVRTL